MQTITLKFTDEQALAMMPAIEAQAITLARNPDVASKLPAGVNVEELGPRKQAKLCLYAALMFIRQNYERDEAARLAADQANAEALASSPLEVDDD